MSAYQQLNVAPNPSNASNGSYLIPGMISLWGGATAPAEWLLCDGSAVSRNAYSNLFQAIGTTFGSGDAGALAFTTTASTGDTQNTITITPTSNPAFDPGKTFTMTGGKTGYSGYVWTVVTRLTNSIVATATQSGTQVIFTSGTDSTPGTIIPNSPTTFNLPNPSGRTVRGVGTAGTTTVTLGGTGGADSVSFTLVADNLPQHRHGVLVPGNGMLAGGSAGGYPNVDNGTNTIAGETRTEAGATVANSAITNATLNQYLGINYIIKT